MLKTLLAAIAAFASTNVDDIFILMVLFAQDADKRKRTQIIAGQYLGIAVLIALSLAGVFLGLIIPGPYIGLLGLFPVYLGFRKLWDQYSGKSESSVQFTGSSETAYPILSVATLTIANGGDNVGIYIPLFSAMPAFALALTVLVFLILTSVWLWLASFLTNHPASATLLQRYVPPLLPFLLITLGVFILWESGTLSLFF